MHNIYIAPFSPPPPPPCASKASARRYPPASGAADPSTPHKGGRGVAAHFGENAASSMKTAENQGGGMSTSFSSMSSFPAPLETSSRRDRFKRRYSLDEGNDEMESRGMGDEMKGVGGVRSGRTRAREKSFGSRSLSLQTSSVERSSARRY